MQPLGTGAASRPGLYRPAGGHGRGGREVGGVGAGRAGRRGPRRRAAGVEGAGGGGGRRRAVEVGQVERTGHKAAVAGRVQQPLSAAAVVQQLVHDHAPGLGARGPQTPAPPVRCARLPPDCGCGCDGLGDLSAGGPIGWRTARARAWPGAARLFNRPSRPGAERRGHRLARLPRARPGHWRRRGRLPAPPPDAPRFQ